MLLSKAKDKDFWKMAATSAKYRNFADELKTLRAQCDSPMPELKMSDFDLFFTTGSRAEYEAAYFSRRRRLNTCALLSLFYPESGEYFEKLCETIDVILDEITWALPAHQARDLSEKYTIDLFAAETGFTLCEIAYLLEDRLDAAQRNRIKTEVTRRIVDSYLNGSFWWEKCAMNWAAVCGGSVGAVLMYLYPEKFYEVKPRLDETLGCFLSGFGSDGACREGLGYWNYGFGFFVVYAALLREFSDGKYNYFTDERIRKIAHFQQEMYFCGGGSVSFSDGAPDEKYCRALVYMLKKEYPDVAIPPENLGYNIDNCARWCTHLRSILYFDEYEDTRITAGEKFFDDAAWYIRRGESCDFAAKGGDNGEPHNHNDIGSFIFSVGGEQVLCDLGGGRYTRQYFNEALRYDIFCNSSLGHSVPIIDGKAQKAGAEYKGKAHFDGKTFTVDAAHAYDNVDKFIRRFDFLPCGIVMRDEFSSQNVVERFITYKKPEISGTSVIWDAARMEFDGRWRAQISEHIFDAKDGKRTVYSVDFTPKNGAREFKMEIRKC